ncbi:WD40 repeat domain-containing protein [Saccharomonospora saliphila]|uniref:WD40 repeat domain-containing protein n=1 Tax=Saccharomonospora saliphila TaxID=369829 RepID=UPI00035DAC70|nr:WD40 repeat domain-containing protein [Saccharomonospora saliphila]
MRLTHEALLRAWPRLAEWVERDRQELVLRGRLDDAARAWLDSGRDESALYRGARLAAAVEWARDRGDLTETERGFLRASTRAEQRSTRRLRGLVAGLATLLVVSLVAGGAALTAQRDAERQRRDAQSRASAAESQLLALPDPVRAKRLALRGWEASHTTQARSALLSAPSLATPLSFDSGFATAYSADVGPDGTLIAVGGPDGRALVWDTGSGGPLDYALSGHTETVWDVAFSPDGTRLATASGEERGVRIWEVASGELVRTLPGAFRVAWRPDGAGIAAFEPGEGGVVVRDPDTGTVLDSLPGTGALVYDLAFHPGGEHIALGRDDGTVELWDTGGGGAAELVLRHHPHTGTTRVAFSADLLATASQDDPEVRLWDARTGAAEGVISQSGAEFGPSGIAFSPDGLRLLTVESDNIVSWDVETRRRSGEYASLGDTITALAVSADGRTVVAATARGDLTRWLRGTGWNTRFSGAAISVSFAPDGSDLTAVDGTGELRTWNAVNGRPSAPAHAPQGTARTVARTPDGGVVVLSVDGTISVGRPDTPGEARRRTLPDRQMRAHPAVSADGRWIAAVSDVDGVTDRVLHVWDSATLTEVARAELGEALVTSPAFGPDGTRLAATVDDEVRVWRLGEDGLTEASTLDVGERTLYALALSPDGATLATVGDGGRIALRDADSGELLRRFDSAHPATVRTLTFSPDGRMLASGTVDDSVVRLWDVGTGSLLANLSGHLGPLNDLAFSPDGRLLASASQDTSVGVWHVRPGDAVGVLCDQLRATPGGAEPSCAHTG